MLRLIRFYITILSLQNTCMLDSGSDHDDIELIPPCAESDPLDAASTVSDISSSGEDELVDDIIDDWEVPEAANHMGKGHNKWFCDIACEVLHIYAV